MNVLTELAMLPRVKAKAMVVRDQPSSSSMDVMNTPRTGPNIGTMPKDATKPVATIAQP